MLNLTNLFTPLAVLSNGEAERPVCTIKNLLKKADDPYAALLAYRSMPVSCGYSPAELLMNRKLRSSVPIFPAQLHPRIPDYVLLTEKGEKIREQQKRNFDSHHRTKELCPLSSEDMVWVTDQQTEGTVVQSSMPRSYQVETASGTNHRNRRHLNPINNAASMEPEQVITETSAPEVWYRTKSYQEQTNFGETCSPH